MRSCTVIWNGAVVAVAGSLLGGCMTDTRSVVGPWLPLEHREAVEVAVVAQDAVNPSASVGGTASSRGANGRIEIRASNNSLRWRGGEDNPILLRVLRENDIAGRKMGLDELQRVVGVYFAIETGSVQDLVLEINRNFQTHVLRLDGSGVWIDTFQCEPEPETNVLFVRADVYAVKALHRFLVTREK